jgi:hypothetical protein
MSAKIIMYDHNVAHLKGREFGSLKVIQRAGNRGKHALWLCKCKCGNMVYRTTGQLNNGCHSCGCEDRRTSTSDNKGKKMLNLINKRYGHLRVICKNEKASTNMVVKYDCECDCGNKVTVASTLLRSGKRTKCHEKWCTCEGAHDYTKK